VRLRPTIRSTATTLAAAAVLVAGANIATYAATGNSLLLGHSNTAGNTTSLKNTGRGSALSLNTAKSAAPFIVNSSKMVKNLNANTVGGKTAAQLNPATLTYRYGTVGTAYPTGTPQLYTANIPKGSYDIDLSGLVLESGSGGSDSYQCLVMDKAALLAAIHGGGTPPYSKWYLLTGDAEGTYNYGILNSVNTAQKITGPVAYGCIWNGSGTYTPARQVQFTFRPVTATTKHGSVLPLTKSAAKRLTIQR
jgi:hypothetical protein